MYMSNAMASSPSSLSYAAAAASSPPRSSSDAPLSSSSDAAPAASRDASAKSSAPPDSSSATGDDKRKDESAADAVDGAAAGGDVGADFSEQTSSSVDPERRRKLLLAARRDRIDWIDGAASPTVRPRRSPSTTTPGPERGDGAAEREGVLGALRGVAACRRGKMGDVAVEVASVLYGGGKGGEGGGIDETRVREQLESRLSPDEVRRLFNAPPPPTEADDDASEHDEDDGGFLASYRTFLCRLKRPECAELANGIRGFVRTMQELERSGAEDAANGERDEDDAGLKRLASAVHKYLDKTDTSMSSHPVWTTSKKGDGDKVGGDDDEGKGSESAGGNDALTSEARREALETFLYVKIHAAIMSVLRDDVAKKEDNTVDERISNLKFVTPTHLEIECLSNGYRGDTSGAAGSDDGDGTDGRAGDAAENDDGIVLSAAVRSIRSIEAQRAPNRMLSCILGAYRGVNEALSNAMEACKVTGRKNLPGADDVLPTLILAVLRAQPRQIASNLRFIELFATPDQLRGEAGYAYTNLFGAVQFLRDLDLDEPDGKGGDGDREKVGDGVAASLHISPDELRSGLERCRREAKALADANAVAPLDAPTLSSGALQNEPVPEAQQWRSAVIPVREVREARLRGEVVDLDWAVRWQNAARDVFEDLAESDYIPVGERTGQGNHIQPAPSLSPPPLPPGFSRSYSFLATQPDDVRVVDVPTLLGEYRMLVHAVEGLLAERTSSQSEENRRNVRLARERLQGQVAEFESERTMNGGKRLD